MVDGELWVGHFGDGLINNYDPVTGDFIVYFSAGIADEEHGLFGLITEDQ